MFDSTVNWGNVLTILIASVGIMGFLLSIRSDLAVIVERIKHFHERVDSISSSMDRSEAQFAKVADMLVNIAKQDDRLTSQDARADTTATTLNTRISKLEADVASMLARVEARDAPKRRSQ